MATNTTVQMYRQTKLYIHFYIIAYAFFCCNFAVPGIWIVTFRV